MKSCQCPNKIAADMLDYITHKVNLYQVPKTYLAKTVYQYLNKNLK